MVVILLLASAGIIFLAAGMTFFLRSKRPTVTEQTDQSPKGAQPVQPVAREDNAIYQDNKLVARVLDPAINQDSREIRFGEIHHCDALLLPEECEFQKYRIMIQRVGFASRVDRAAPEKGRVLREVVAEILGYRVQ